MRGRGGMKKTDSKTEGSPARLFNSSLDGKVRRAIDIREGEEIDARAFRELIRAAVALNLSGKKT